MQQRLGLQMALELFLSADISEIMRTSCCCLETQLTGGGLGQEMAFFKLEKTSFYDFFFLTSSQVFNSFSVLIKTTGLHCHPP